MSKEQSAKETMLYALGEIGEEREGEEGREAEKVKNLLAYSLDSDGVCVFDAMVGDFTKRERSDGERVKGDKGIGFAARAMRKMALEKEAKFNRINPMPKLGQRRQQEYETKLKLAKEGIDASYYREVVAALWAEIKDLCKEVKIKDYERLAKYKEYEAKRKECEALVDAAAREAQEAEKKLKDREFGEVEDYIGRLEGRAEQIKEAYRGLVQVLQDMYDEVCFAIESSERGLKAGGFREVEKEQYAPLKGEDGKIYLERMKKLGRGKEVPEEIKQVDLNIERSERRWQRMAAVSADEFARIKANWRKTIFDMMDRASVAMNVFPERLNSILEEGIKGGGENRSRGKSEAREAARVEQILGGSVGAATDTIYGCLHTKAPIEGDGKIGGQYGKNVIRWKSGAVCATMFCGDSVSLTGDWIGCCTKTLLSDPSPVSFNPNNRRVVEVLKQRPIKLGLKSFCSMLEVPYIELQLYRGSGLGIEDIESISFHTEDDIAMLSPSALEAIRELKIPTYVNGREVQIDKAGMVGEERE